ncbi:AMP-binding protein [Nocardia brasiliensis]|uniref:Carboxylic acid reductase n=1 Tax=Nocardia brasiliensis TaxID=37326 RepID=A0A6G9XT36_NOCBR|nr:carboxylic acid reductase [Nocardia brasiliensis]QIS03993.1 AMP-binding protein [Nocardia brasiliensis]
MTTDSRSDRLRRRIAQLFSEDEQVKAAVPDEEVTAAIKGSGLRLPQIVATVMQRYADRPAVGQRAVEAVTDSRTARTTFRLLPEFETLTYRELWARVGEVAAAWHGDPEHPLRAGDFVALLGFTSIDYGTLDLANVHLGLVTVPLQSGAAVAQLAAILDETAPRVLAATPDHLDVAVELLTAGAAPRRLVVFDYRPADDDHREALESARRRLAEAGSSVVVETLDAVRARGSALPPAPLYVPEPDEDPLSLLIYTSGSTGTPKGAMYTEALNRRAWLGGPKGVGITLCYMPMSHIAGRFAFSGVLARGGTAYFTAKSDMSTLFEDLGIVRPTEMFLVPRVCDMLFQRYQAELSRRAPQGDASPELEEDLLAELRLNYVGDRLLGAIAGSAPLSAEMRAFMESLLDLELHDGYGSTEAGVGVLQDNVVQRPPVLDYKLVDVPELGYFLTDRPHPRGELLLKTESMIQGYFRRPEVTAEIFDADGFYKTGDIVAELEPDRLVYLDRRNNVLKLAQGEFVAVAHLESVFATSPLIRQIFIYGNSERSFLLAVIVPTAAALADGVTDALKSALTDSLQQIAKEAELQSYELPREFLIETEPFTVENGLLSGIAKLLRPKLKAHYGDRLEQLYRDIEQDRAAELTELRRTAADRPVLDTVTRVARSLLGAAATELRPDAHFTDLGGDSLTALSYSTLLQDMLDVEVPVGVIVSPANTLGDLAKYIEAQRESGSLRPTLLSVHGPGTEVRAADLTLDKFIDAHTLSAAKTVAPAPEQARTVLLTGANGYLGRFLCLEWLQRLHETGGTLVCLVRGSDAAAARKRLDAVFDSGDPALLAHYRELAAEHLEVLAGDIGDPNLGLDEANWRRLAATVDLIVHPAALVNHVLPYNQLFGPNVVGTAEIIRLALTERRKPVTYLSTVGVATQVDPAVFDEDLDIREMSAVRTIDAGYANGYSNSKWAGEVLLRQAHDLCGLPVAVFRSDMILAHSTYVGQLNVPDVFTRLILSLVLTGIAPYSFYVTDSAGRRQRAHYDGLPADFVAEAITTLGARTDAGFHTYDVWNPYDDGISLDEFVDWLADFGVPIQRIEDHGEWFRRMETAIRALPEKQRDASLLPLLDAYRRPLRAVRGSALPAKNFQAAVQAARIGPDNDIPHLSPALIDKYVTDLRHLGLL